MSLRNAKSRVVLLLATLLAPAAVFRAMPAPTGNALVTLPSAVEVRSETLALSDLLPPGAPSDLLRAASGIALGNTPEPGSLRTIVRGEIEDLLRAEPELRASLSLPEHIIVSRSHRELTSHELSAAISDATGGPGALPLNLKLSAPVYVTKDDPGLKVVRVEFDPLRRDTRFCLWASKEPDILPFYVTVSGGSVLSAQPALVARRDLAPGEIAGANDFMAQPRKLTTAAVGQLSQMGLPVTPEALAGRAARAYIKAGQVVNASMFRTVVMVNQGKLAVLVMEGRSFQISVPVIPLENGVLGQQVRVRNIDSRRVVAAEVVGPGRLRKTLEN
ncbi:MAG TPA: flagellar basal body P-ring formation chaperone FlgA [Terriglobia bacterium]|nr:flagellar basal body P-ring formation chaperone FlgA [Terriglobia bacterium]